MLVFPSDKPLKLYPDARSSRATPQTRVVLRHNRPRPHVSGAGHLRRVRDRIMKRWIGVVTLAVALPAQADHYRCDVDGTPTFQDFPCGEERPGRNAPLTVIGGESNGGKLLGNALTQDIPAVKAHAERQQRINEVIVARRLAHGMSEADARLVYGAPQLIENDGGGCRRLIWRNPDHAARVCFGTVAHVYY